MADNASDEILARALQQAGILSFDQLEAARLEQAAQAKTGISVNLAEVLTRQGVITPAILENITRRVQARQAGGLKQIGPYRLIRKLGEGGMGQVYLAEDTQVGRTVAIKILLKKFADDHQFLTRFRREAQATGKLNHANIVCAYTVGEEQGVHYYAMEYCDGEGLDRVLKRVPFIPWKVAAGVILQVARGLGHAHEHGIIHRDIKPENILICRPPGSAGAPPAQAAPLGILAEGYVAKILDLGLSKDLGGASSSFYTQTGMAMGTPHYISPEQARGDSQIDGRTDIYSLGATFYHLVTGATPYSGSTATIVMMKHISEPSPQLREVNDHVPDGVAQVIQKMMAKAPEDRYASCRELQEDLEAVIDDREPSRALVRRGLLPQRGEGRRSTRRHESVGHKSAGAVERRGGRGEPAEPNAEASSSKMPLYAGMGVGVLLLIGVLALTLGGGEKTASKTGKDDKAGSTPPPPAIGTTVPPVLTPPSDREKLAQDALDAALRFEGLAADDKAGRIARLEAFLKEYETGAAAARARTLLGELRKPPATRLVTVAVPTPAMPTPLPKLGELRWTPVDSSKGKTAITQGSEKDVQLVEANTVKLTGSANLVYLAEGNAAGIRAKVAKLGGQNLGLYLRTSAGGGYVAWFNGGDDFGIGICEKAYRDLARGRSRRRYDVPFRMTFLIEGDQLRLLADEELVVTVRNSVCKAGVPGIGVYNNGLATFQNIEVSRAEAEAPVQLVAKPDPVGAAPETRTPQTPGVPAKAPATVQAREALEKLPQFAGFKEALAKAEIAGGELLKDGRAFRLQSKDGKAMVLGQDSKNRVLAVKNGAIEISQSEGGGTVIVPLSFSSLDAQTRGELVILGLPPGPQSALKLAFAGLSMLERGEGATTPQEIAKRLDEAAKDPAQADLVAILRDRLEAAKRESAALQAWDRAEKLYVARDHKNAKTAFLSFEEEYRPTVAYSQKAQALKERLAAIDLALGLKEVVIEAFIDGLSYLHLTPTGIYWTSGGVAKPGRHNGHNEATWVNGQPWMPKWGQPEQERGKDQSDVLRLPLVSTDFQFELLAVGDTRGAKQIDQRDPVTLERKPEELIVSIPDSQSGSKWYRFRLFRP